MLVVAGLWHQYRLPVRLQEMMCSNICHDLRAWVNFCMQLLLQHPHALLQWHDAFDSLGVRLRGTLHALRKRKVGLRIIWMHEERCPPRDMSAPTMMVR